MYSLVTLLLAAAACSERPQATATTPPHADLSPEPSVAAPPAPPATAPPPSPPAEAEGPKAPTEQDVKLVMDLSRERSDGGPPSEPLVAKRNKVSVADVEAAERTVETYRDSIATTAKANLKRMARGTVDGTYSLEHSKVGFTTVMGTDLGPYTAGMLIMVRACNTDADFSEKLEKAVKDPIAALPPDSSGYIAHLGYNDEWSCTGWLDQKARYDAAANSVSIR